MANAWDANASEVKILLRRGNRSDSIVVSDNGHGMTFNDIGDKYLRVGRKRRDEEGGKTDGGQRDVMGRNGIGKLTIFGVARKAEIRTVRKKKLSVIIMDLDDILSGAQRVGTYAPEVVRADEDTTEDDGTTVTLTDLTRKGAMGVQSIKRGIAKRFAVIGDKFAVSVNGQRILPSDKFRDGDWEKTWTVDEPVSNAEPGWVVSGTIMAARQPLSEDDRGITVTARGKMIQSPTMFGIKSGSSHSHSYITGEIRAEFCDGDVDSVATDRQSVTDTPQGVALMEWGADKIGRISDELTRIRKTAREAAIMEDPKIKSWLDSLDVPQAKMAHKIVRAVMSDEKMDDAKRIDLVKYAMASFGQRAFLEVVSTLDEHQNPAELLDVFREYNVVEARELERTVKDRMEAISRLVALINGNAREVPTLRDYFRKYPWMLDPTWIQWQDEVYFSKLLNDKFPNEEMDGSNRRMDFVAIGAGNTIYVVELKRPGHRVSYEDVVQLSRYVGFVKTHLGNYPSRPYKKVVGYLVVGKMSNDSGIRHLVNGTEKSEQYIRTYADLVASAKQLHKHFDDKIKEFEEARSKARLERQS